MPDKKGSDDRAYARGFAAGRAAASPDPPDMTNMCEGESPDHKPGITPAATPDPPRTVLDPETGIEEPVTTGRIPDAEFVEPPLMPPAASPDERLREATPREAIKAVLAANRTIERVLAAADREAPEPRELGDIDTGEGWYET